MHPPASVITSSYNRANMLNRWLDALLNLDYPQFEIVVVNDGSTDNTAEVLENYKKKYRNKIKVINHEKNKGQASGRMDGIRASKYDIIALLDDDMIVNKNWLKHLVNLLMKGVKNKVAIISSIDPICLQSAVCLKDVIVKAGGFDERFPIAFRDDTDLVFRVKDLGYKVIQASKLNYVHKKPKPKTLEGKLNRFWRHFLIFQSDCLLFKKNPERTRELLEVKYRFVSPLWDFKHITGISEKQLFYSQEDINKKKFMRLGSPQGIFYIKGNKKTIPLIFVAGVLYAILLKFVRLYGSIKFGTFLI